MAEVAVVESCDRSELDVYHHFLAIVVPSASHQTGAKATQERVPWERGAGV